MKGGLYVWALRGSRNMGDAWQWLIGTSPGQGWNRMYCKYRNRKYLVISWERYEGFPYLLRCRACGMQRIEKVCRRSMSAVTSSYMCSWEASGNKVARVLFRLAWEVLVWHAVLAGLQHSVQQPFACHTLAQGGRLINGNSMYPLPTRQRKWRWQAQSFQQETIQEIKWDVCKWCLHKLSALIPSLSKEIFCQTQWSFW